MEPQGAREAVAAKKAEGQKAHIQLVRDYREVFDTKAGERVLRDLMQQAEVMEMTPMEALQHPHMLSYANGKRDLYLHISLTREQDPDWIEQLIAAGELAKEEADDV